MNSRLHRILCGAGILTGGLDCLRERRWVLSAHAKKRVKNFNFGAILGRALVSLLKKRRI